jgi:hypothetical protein
MIKKLANIFISCYREYDKKLANIFISCYREYNKTISQYIHKLLS